jgi:HlyD family secretion protein
MPDINAMKWYILVMLVVAAASGSLGAYYLLNNSLSGPTEESPPRLRTTLVWVGFVDLRHGPAGLYPAQPGRVVKVQAREGQEVKQGTPLLALDDAAAQLQVKEAGAALEAARWQLAKAQTLPEQHRARIAQQESALEACDRRIAAAELMYVVKKKLHKNSLLSTEELAAVEKQIEELKALRSVERQKLAELNLIDPQTDLKMAQAEVARLEAKAAQANRAIADCTLQAPADGTVMRILINPGEMLAWPAQQPAIVFAPSGPWIIRAEIEQEFASKVHIGQPVGIEDDTNVEPLGQGTIAEVSNWFLPRRFQSQDPTRINSGRTLECIIALEPGHRTLRIGQRVRVRIGP